MTRKINVTCSSMPPFEEYVKEIKSLWDSHWLTNMGVKHAEFENELMKFFNIEHVALFTNGHSALEMLLQALDLPKGSEVITTPFTFASTTHAIVRNGLKPVFADIRKDNYTLDPRSVESKINENTSAILPVHVYGGLCDVEAFQNIADEYNLRLIYDAAHAFAVQKNDVNCAHFGDASMFSFHATKVFNTIEGGCVATDDDELSEKLYNLKNFGIRGEERVLSVGGNAKMNEFCASMGICNLRYLHGEIKKRKSVFERYVKDLSLLEGIQLLKVEEGVVPNYAYMPIVFDDDSCKKRDEVYSSLKANGIGARKYFYPLVSDYECYREKYNSTETPVAKSIAERVLTLPMFADLELASVDAICNIIDEG